MRDGESGAKKTALREERCHGGTGREHSLLKARAPGGAPSSALRCPLDQDY